MKVTVSYLGPVKRAVAAQSHEQELAEPTAVQDLLFQLGYNEREQRFLIVSVNGTRVEGSTIVNDGDAVVVSLLLGGG